MYIKDITNNEQPQTIYHTDIGTLTVFKTYIVSELKEGLTIDFDSWLDILDIIYDHFGNDGNFGLICNRVNPYSIVPMDLGQLDNLFIKNPKIAIINYSSLGSISAEYERTFWPFPVVLFNDLSAGIIWVDEALEKVS